LVVGVAALLSGQPYPIWYPLVLGGGIIALVEGLLLPQIYRRYHEADERRRGAAELRGGAAPAVSGPPSAPIPATGAVRPLLLAVDGLLLGGGLALVGVGTAPKIAATLG